MIEVHYERGKYKVVQLDHRYLDTFITSMYLTHEEASDLCHLLMEKLNDNE